jgi:hypothetical protein
MQMVQSVLCEKAASFDALPLAIDRLRCAAYIESGSRGFTGEPGPLNEAFRAAVHQLFPIDMLQEQANRATPAGQLYLATLIFMQDAELGRVALEEVAQRFPKVTYQHGCIFPGEAKPTAELAMSVWERQPIAGLSPTQPQ